MTDIKIVFFDIDGTLIDMKKKCISEKTLETLRRLKEKGIRICVATGRSPMQVPRFPGVEFDAFLTYNGSYCFDRHQDIFSNPLGREDVRTLIKNAAGIGRPVSVATKSRLAANGITGSEDWTWKLQMILMPWQSRRKSTRSCWDAGRKIIQPYWKGPERQRSQPGGTALWISFLPMAGKGSRLTECWTFIIYQKKRQWLSAMGIMTLKCCRQWGMGSRCRMLQRN